MRKNQRHRMASIGLLFGLSLNVWGQELAEMGVLSADIRYADAPAKLCVVNTQNTGGSWFLLQDWSTNRQLSIAAAMMLVSEIRIDSAQRWLAVMSVGEGHPVIEVFALREVLAAEPPQVATAVWELNPYPGIVNLVGWENGVLLLESDRQLTQTASEMGYPELPNDSRRFAFDPVTKNLTLLPADASR